MRREQPSSSSGSAAATCDSGQSADQIVKDSEAKMAAVTSAAFTADFKLQIEGDTSKMTDPTAKALLGQGVSVSAEGKSATKPAAADMTMSVGIAGQTLEFGMKAVGNKAWLEYQGAWYKVDNKNSKALGQQAQTARRPPSNSRAWASTRPRGAPSTSSPAPRTSTACRSTTSRPRPTRRSWPSP